MYYFVGTGREAGTLAFPPGGPARQFFYIVTDGFTPPASAAAKAEAGGSTTVIHAALASADEGGACSISSQDSDGDGLTDVQEQRLGLDTRCADTDRDGIPDAVDPELTPILEVFPNVTISEGEVCEFPIEVHEPARIYINVAAGCGNTLDGADMLAVALRSSLSDLTQLLSFDGGGLHGAIAGRERVLDLDAGSYSLAFYGAGEPRLYWMRAGYARSAVRMALEGCESLSGVCPEMRFAAENGTALHVDLASGAGPIACFLDGCALPLVACGVDDEGSLLSAGDASSRGPDHTLLLELGPQDYPHSLRVRQLPDAE
jgi:hypothetical protein